MKKPIWDHRPSNRTSNILSVDMNLFATKIHNNKNITLKLMQIRKVIYTYFSFVFESILDGHTFKFPNKIGYIRVEKRVKDIKKEYRYSGGRKKVDYKTTVNRIGYYYKICFHSELLEKSFILFRAPKYIRIKLWKILINTDKDYNYAT